MMILAAVDLSNASVDAARTAVTLARRLGDEVLLVHAVEPLAGGPGSAETAAHTANLEALKNLRASLAADDVGVELRVIEGRPYDALMACVETCKPRLIIMGSHGRPAFARLLLGSVTQKMILASPSPVLVMREGAAPFAAWAQGERRLRITAGIDRGGSGAAVVNWLKPLHATGNTELTLLHEYWPAREQARLGIASGPIETSGTAPGTRSVGDGDVAGIIEHELREELLEQGVSGDFQLRVCPVQGPVSEQLGIDAQTEAADLLVITNPHGSHGRSPPSAWGSTAAATMSAVRVPLLVLPVSKTEVVDPKSPA